MGVDVSTEAVIARPRHEVAEIACDPDQATSWYANILAVAWKTPGPLRIGTRLEFTAKFLGRRLVYTYEVVDHVPDERFVMRTADGPFPMETTYEFEDAADGATLMRLRNRGDPSGFAKVTAPFMERAMRSANEKDLRRLSSLLE
ncbi:SRPBCC family protein [Microbacterium sp. LWH3-1.2]|uniref:SRPBCC family protein n=1 Tax=Microbacterium sp. LWH3-1.2 TaxID=3135256 RepID=UPI00341BEC77